MFWKFKLTPHHHLFLNLKLSISLYIFERYFISFSNQFLSLLVLGGFQSWKPLINCMKDFKYLNKVQNGHANMLFLLKLCSRFELLQMCCTVEYIFICIYRGIMNSTLCGVLRSQTDWGRIQSHETSWLFLSNQYMGTR